MTLAERYTFAGRAFLETDVARLRPYAPPEALDLLDAAPLEPEYVRLFLNPAGAPCSPWQSANEEESRLMGDAHLSALRWYAKYGASPRTENDPADHVGLLLLFAAQLLTVSGEPAEFSEFAGRHLAWLPNWLAKVENETRHPFYHWLAGWTARLNGLPGVPDAGDVP